MFANLFMNRFFVKDEGNSDKGQFGCTFWFASKTNFSGQHGRFMVRLREFLADVFQVPLNQK